ncbi:LacI family transcriptional regulator [Occultella glacieicola]|uniref:LacI family transcriptional regulator n=1 Tax=Occultella glacieicola TaxID=2518684 RepID=A0ABY2E1D5_9MICO|nr:LacI family DNA-binding transcriptional regulator [Occultella glacieicola]TDE89182.1 LacI family transcriptional regulator [Occultella glacieicola]
MSRPTLADVAARAGVSAKTVSNVLLGRRHVAEATRARVLEAVTEVGYTVNAAGRGLASGRTGRVAVVVPMIYQPYFAEVAERLILALAEHGLTTTLRIAHDDAAERDAVLGLTTPDVDGVILCPHGLSPEVLGDGIVPRPVVQLGGGIMPSFDCVIMGETEGFRSMTEHLLATGRKRIALIGTGPGGAPQGSRFAGYLEALTAHGIDLDERLLITGSDWDRRASGYEAVVGLLRTGVEFDAVMCFNDAMAVGALRGLRSHGLRVPQDVALTGFDDTAEVEFTSPPLSSVSPEQAQMVAATVRMLIERIDGYAGEPRVVRTGAHLVPRESSAPAESAG